MISETLPGEREIFETGLRTNIPLLIIRLFYRRIGSEVAVMMMAGIRGRGEIEIIIELGDNV